MVQLPVMHQASICDVKLAEQSIAMDPATLRVHKPQPVRVMKSMGACSL